jgi:hypothetical protein
MRCVCVCVCGWVNIEKAAKLVTASGSVRMIRRLGMIMRESRMTV